MNKSALKSYAPQARRDFIQAVTDRARVLGLSEKKIEPVEVKGDVAMIAGRPFPRDVAKWRGELEVRINLKGFTQVMEEVAYTWFNRFTALRYMELHDYLGHGYRVLSNPSGSDIPEIMEKATSVDLPGLDKDKVAELRLAGDKGAELYRMLLVKQCNALHRVMPMLFEAVNDATELLLPENLLQTNSPIRKLVNDIPEENWSKIEIVGWLYQFYISEKKDQVIGKVVKSEDIPAATQLFTPNWIVKYMVQNTLGRKWLMTYPASSIKGKMEFYIEPAEQAPEVQARLDAITPRELNPEELTFMDPACGSGHILAEAYDLFKEIYLERGYRTRDIPRLILEKNLFGLDIDDRAAQLARFTVLMKARADDRRILDRENPARLNIMAIQESKGLAVDEVARVLLRERVKEIGVKGQQQLSLLQSKMSQARMSEIDKPDVTREELYSLLHLFEDGKTFGSLLTVHDRLKKALPRLRDMLATALKRDTQSAGEAKKVVPLFRQALLLARQYDVVVANPPYMGSKGLNPRLKEYAKDEYPDSKSDLFAMFIERGFEMVKEGQFNAMVTMQSWMFLSSYEKLRLRLLEEATIDCMVHMANMVMGIAFGTAAAIWRKSSLPGYKGSFSYVNYEDLGDSNKPKEFPVQNERLATASASDFKKIPGSPIAYWLTDAFFRTFENTKIRTVTTGEGKNVTSNNALFVRLWWEVDCRHIGEGLHWVSYAKGGPYRKWYGNVEHIVDWSNRARDFYKSSSVGRIVTQDQWYKEGITWTDITSSGTGFRYLPEGGTFDATGLTIFIAEDRCLYSLLGILNSQFSIEALKVLNPTMHAQLIDVKAIPLPGDDLDIKESVLSCIGISKDDWNSKENSPEFSVHPLVLSKDTALQLSFSQIVSGWVEQTQKLFEIEKDINKQVIREYGLSDELGSIPQSHLISLSCNPHYRYGLGKTKEEYDNLLRSDTTIELLSYAIGCMMGRYSLDESGLIYAHSGNEGFDPSRYTTFPADEDGIVPVMPPDLGVDWFEDDATNRFEEFLRVAWSPETLDENLKFVADSLEPKRGETPIDTIRRFISQKFFKDHHLKVYKKRPIYWLFSSGKQRAFECLVYLHRYNENTLARMRAMYVTPLQGKYNARIEYLEKELPAASSTSAAKKLHKELGTVRKKQQELREFDELLRHFADQRISLDLDDGVKVNYGKFGKLLAEVKAVTGEQS